MTEDENFISLKEYVNTRFNILHDDIEKTSMQLDKRLDSMNEFRAQLSDQTKTFITRAEHDALLERVNKSEQRISNFDGRTYAIGVFITIITIGVSIALHFIH